MEYTRPLKDIPIVRLDTQRNKKEHQRELLFLGAALEDIGFCYIENHGISFQLLTECYYQYKRFFDLPREVKMRYARPDLGFQRGWTPPAAERALESQMEDSKENLFFGPPLVPDSLLREFPRHYHKNIWPEETPEMQKPTLDLFDQFMFCGKKILRFFEEYLSLRPEYLLRLIADGPHVLRPLHYPAVTKETAGKIVWGGEHTDINLITILPPSTAQGLMIRRRDGEWIAGTAPQNCVLVQVGDQLQYMTGGRFISAKHRVDAPTEESSGRLSLAFFIHTRSNVLLSLIPSCQKQCGNPALYRPIRAGAFVDERLRGIKLSR